MNSLFIPGEMIKPRQRSEKTIFWGPLRDNRQKDFGGDTCCSCERQVLPAYPGHLRQNPDENFQNSRKKNKIPDSVGELDEGELYTKENNILTNTLLHQP